MIVPVKGYGEKIMIDINVTLIMTILNFVILLVILRIILFKPVTKFLDERARTIADSLRLAEENKKRAEEISVEKDAIITDTRRKASEIIDKATVNAHEESHEIIRKAREETQTILASAQKELAEEAGRVKRALRAEVSEMVVAIAEKVLVREIRAEEHKDIIEDGLGKLER